MSMNSLRYMQIKEQLIRHISALKPNAAARERTEFYTITYSVTDQAGHVTNAAATVTVKQDNSEHHDGEDEQS